jgi:uncharacterized repeat protein (TIGR03803 family)
MKNFIAAGIAVFIVTSPVAAGQPKLTTIYSWADDYPSGLTDVGGKIYVAGPLSGECGAVMRLDPPEAAGRGWSVKVLHTFAGYPDDGCYPIGGPVAGPDGSLYGLTFEGGANGSGILYRLRPPASGAGPWSEQVLYSFNPSPGMLVPGPGGSFYVTNEGGDYGAGALLQLLPPSTPGEAWTGTQILSIGEGRGPGTPTSLVAGPGGSLYATSYYGGDSYYGFGTVFQMSPPSAGGVSWTVTVLHSFGAGVFGTSLAYSGSLVLASDGTLYGTAYGGGDDFGGPSVGGVFALSPPSTPGGEWEYSALHAFLGGPNVPWPVALHPDTSLILRGNTLIFGGMSLTGGYLLQMRPPSAPGGAWTMTPLYEFTNNELPQGQMYLDARGTLFGIQGSTATYGSRSRARSNMVTGIAP